MPSKQFVGRFTIVDNRFHRVVKVICLPSLAISSRQSPCEKPSDGLFRSVFQ